MTNTKRDRRSKPIVSKRHRDERVVAEELRLTGEDLGTEQRMLAIGPKRCGGPLRPFERQANGHPRSKNSSARSTRKRVPLLNICAWLPKNCAEPRNCHAEP